MKAIRRLLIVSLAATMLWVCVPISVGATSNANEKSAVAEGNNRFAVELYAKLKETQGNQFFSPFSISSALALAYAGAQDETAQEMTKIFHFGPDQAVFHRDFGSMVKAMNAGGKKKGYELAIANGVWVAQGLGLKKDYLNLVQKDYGAGIKELNFAKDSQSARKTINDWVAKHTDQKIKDLLPPGLPSAGTKVVLTNAVYFKGEWAHKFKKEGTKDLPFTTLDGKKIKVPTMCQTESFNYLEEDSLKALELPYVGRDLSMVILLPKKTDGLKELERNLSYESVHSLFGKVASQEVAVCLPRFKMKSKFMLADTLAAMGMKQALSAPPADFSGMNGRKDLFISQVVHEGFVDVNEEGTEAAAATGVTVKAAMSMTSAEFKADHPFIFLIRDRRSGAILFMGRVEDPTAK